MRDIRISLLVMILLLISLGVIFIYSSSCVYALQEKGNPLYFLNRHLIFLGLGFLLSIAAMIIDYRDLRPWAKPIMLFSIFTLVLLFVPGVGRTIFGARRWFRIGPFSFQPSEFTKLAILIYMADLLSRKKGKIKDFQQGFLPPIIVLGVACLLIVIQPDLGNSILLGAIVLIMLFAAGAQIKHIGLLGLLSLPAIYFLVVKVPYRMARMMAFWDPWEDRQGVGFQLTQSQMALGSGGIWGVGLGKSVQKLFYLPAAHTDFVFSIIGEEIGLVGTLAVILLFAAFIWQGARIVKRTEDMFGYFLGIGIIVMIGLQAAINIGVSIGALPTKGLPLPFISYGGSALVVNMVSVALLLNISRVQDL
jgi:cell division protein FtsW